MTRVCPSIHPSVWLSTGGGGGYPSQVPLGGYLPRVLPSQVRTGGTPARGTHLGYPQLGKDGGYAIHGTHPPRLPPSQVRMGVPQPGGTDLRYHNLIRSGGGIHQPEGPTWGTLQLGQDGGTPARRTHLGYPPARSGQGVPQPGKSTQSIPWLGQDRGVPNQGGPAQGTPWQGCPPHDRTADGVLDTLWSVCLLHSLQDDFLVSLCLFIHTRGLLQSQVLSHLSGPRFFLGWYPSPSQDRGTPRHDWGTPTARIRVLLPVRTGEPPLARTAVPPTPGTGYTAGGNLVQFPTGRLSCLKK